MQCPIDDPRLSAWADGELDAGESALFEAHVARCDECSEFVAATRSTRFASPQPDPSFVVRFRRAREARSETQAWLTWRKLAFGLVPLAAAMLIAAILVVSSTDVDPITEIELEALGDPMALEEGEGSALMIALEPFPDELP